MDKKTDQLVTFSLMQVSEAGNSNRSENLILWKKKVSFLNRLKLIDITKLGST